MIEASQATPASAAVPLIPHTERLRIMAAGIRYGYMAGHNDTVEASYGDPDEVAADYAPEILGELGDAPPAAVPVAEGEDCWYPGFADWLEKEMPEGTVIGDPLWWASKIASHLAHQARPAAPATPEVGEVGELVAWLHDYADAYRGYSSSEKAIRVATLLQQQEEELNTLRSIEADRNLMEGL